MSDISDSNEPFICVNHQRTRRQRNRRKYKLSEKDLKLLNELKVISNESDFDLNAMKEKIDLCVNDLTESSYLNRVFKAMNVCFDRKFGTNACQSMAQVCRVVCYGLGNFGTSIASLYQLSLVVSLRVVCPMVDIHVFDPIFTENEINFLKKKLLFRVIEANERCAHGVDSRSDQMVMFFMPHCDKSLFNNILWANWDTNQLKNILIFGNSFQKMLETIECERNGKQIYKYLVHISDSLDDVLIESVVENNFKPNNIFNDLSIHAFNERNVSEDLLQKSYSKEKPIYEQSGDVL